MAVISVSVLEKGPNGKVQVSRQFLPVTRARIEALQQAFPKLWQPKSQHTFIETEQVRYVYQSLEEIYIVIITNKMSNLIEDLETLKLVVGLLKAICGVLSKVSICVKAFEQIFAFDEVVAMGYRENISVQQVQTFLEMDSHEEKLQNIITDSKILEVKRRAQEKSEEIERKKMLQRTSMYNSTNSNVYEHIQGSSSMKQSSTYEILDTPIPKNYNIPSHTTSSIKGISSDIPTTSYTAPKIMKSFSQSKKRNDIETNRSTIPLSSHNLSVQESSDTVKIIVEEHCTMQADIDGNIQEGKQQGEMKLLIQDSQYTNIAIQTNINDNTHGAYKTILRPELSKRAFETGIIVPSSTSTTASTSTTNPFPISDKPIVLCKWIITNTMIQQYLRNSNDTNFISPFIIPITLSIDINDLDFETSRVDIELQLNKKLETCSKEKFILKGLQIQIPYTGIEMPKNLYDTIDTTIYPKNISYNNQENYILWNIKPLMGQECIVCDTKYKASFEVESGLEKDDISPLIVRYISPLTITPFLPQQAVLVDSKEPIAFEIERNFLCDRLSVRTVN